jgi:hypothetical protein
VLLTQNRWRSTHHWIIVSFLLISISLFVMLDGDTTSLSAVYSISFLSVMALFAVGDMLLKFKVSFNPLAIAIAIAMPDGVVALLI